MKTADIDRPRLEDIMLSLVESARQLTPHDWLAVLVWAGLGLHWILAVTMAFAALIVKTTASLMSYRRRKRYEEFFAAFRDIVTSAPEATPTHLGTVVRRHVEPLLPLLPKTSVGTFIRWRAMHAVDSTAVEQKIALVLAEAEGCSSRLLDFIKVTSPLLGLAGTLLGLQEAFNQSNLGKAAVDAGLATALYTTFAGIVIAISAFFTLRFQIEPLLENFEAELRQVNLGFDEIYATIEYPTVTPAAASLAVEMPESILTTSEMRPQSSTRERLAHAAPPMIDDERFDGA